MRDIDPSSIPIKANVVLNLILIAFLLLAIRIWHLTVIQYDEKFEQSKKPQRKTVVETAERGTIRDRYNTPLAINKIAYRASVTYSPIRELPYSKWEVNAEGVRVKKLVRKEYIHSLSEMLGKALSLDSARVEDLIYSKAALYFNLPYVLKEEISESTYYKLKSAEKDWPGLTVQRYAKREYPKGRLGADVIGYLGAISKEEYEDNIREMKSLEAFLTQWENGEEPSLPAGFNSSQEVRIRYKDLEELAYTAKDYVGKTGVETAFEEHLRGFQGKRSYYTDSKGHFLKDLPGVRAPLNGKRVLLTISEELQEYAERLLAENEEVRQAKISTHGGQHAPATHKQPWIKGGAIVALDPSNGDILAFASYPRFDPNDFITSSDSETAKEKKMRIHKWFEDEIYLGYLWDQVLPLQREKYDRESGTFYDEEKWIDWNTYLKSILPEDHPIVDWFAKKGTIKNVAQILEHVNEAESYGKTIREWIRSKDQEFFQTFKIHQDIAFLPTPYTKILFIDLCQIALNPALFDTETLKEVAHQTIAMHRQASAAYVSVHEGVKLASKEIFHDLIFTRWREKNEKAFLKEKRKIEQDLKIYPKPYIDYLDEKESELFQRFWNKIKYDLILTLLKGENATLSTANPFFLHFQQLHHEIEQGAHPELFWKKGYSELQKILQTFNPKFSKNYLVTLRSYSDLTRPLKGKYRGFRNGKNPGLEKHLAAAFYPTYGFGYGRSNAYRQAATLGSIFKLVTSHEALLQVNHDSLAAGKGIKTSNPLKVIDQVFKHGNQTFVGYTSAGKPIPQLYKGGRIPRSHKQNLGEMDLSSAIETSSNLYFSLLAGDVLNSPNDLVKAAKSFGLGSKTGIELPGEIPGKIPQDLETNRTGLYATAIGQHSLVVTPLQTALLLSTFANHGELLKPNIVKALAGIAPEREEAWLESSPFVSPSLTALGLDFSLFSPLNEGKRKSILMPEKTVRETVPMPSSVRKLLFNAMHRVVLKTQAESLWTLSKLYAEHPEAISDYIDLKHHIIGKTSTAEQMERIDLDEENGTNLYTHVWFGGISFEDPVTTSLEKPDLIIVVYLKYGAYGKEAAPVAAQMVQKWREIKKKHAQN